jgi:hypothetical protein
MFNWDTLPSLNSYSFIFLSDSMKLFLLGNVFFLFNVSPESLKGLLNVLFLLLLVFNLLFYSLFIIDMTKLSSVLCLDTKLVLSEIKFASSSFWVAWWVKYSFYYSYSSKLETIIFDS